MPIYEPGDTARIFCDLYPATVTTVVEVTDDNGQPTQVAQLAPGLPTGRLFRAIIYDRVLVIAWQDGANAAGAIIRRVDIPLAEGETELATLRGGAVGPINPLTGEPMFRVAIAAGCRTCGAGAIKRWHPFPGVVAAETPRTALARQQQQAGTYGVPPKRYTR